MICETKA